MEVHHGQSIQERSWITTKEEGSKVNPDAALEPVQKAVTTASIVSHIRNNRIEYLLIVGISHLMGLTDRLWTQASGIC